MATIEDFGALYYFPSDTGLPRMLNFDYTGAFSFDEKEARLPVHSMDSVESSGLLSIAEEHDQLLKDETDRSAPDLEAQNPLAPSEYSVPTSKKLFYLSLYFVLNLSVTLSNKAILQTVSGL